MFEIHRIILPNISFQCKKAMYLRYNPEKVICHIDDNTIKLCKGGVITTDTFYNAFSLDKWKANTSLDNLSLKISGRGHIIVKIMHLNLGISPVTLIQKTLTLTDQCIITIPAFNDLHLGLLYVEIQALSESQIDYSGFFTTTRPINPVNLGIIITHFNRKEQIHRAINRITDDLFSDPFFQDKISLTVIDNSKNCDIRGTANVSVIENDNTGGSGGFARGLMHLMNSGQHTHCLFMDDDASCEVESIRRAFHILSYTHKKKLAISGALLRELEPSILFEKGAIFNGHCQPLKSGSNLLDIRVLLDLDFPSDKPNYGAWWFFAFKLEDVEYFPFPFFVRGDDITFSLANQFTIFTMNGIASFGSDFELKSGSLPLYLDLRSTLVMQSYFLDYSYLSIIKTTSRFFLSALFSHNYGTAQAICQAIKDFMAGPEFFVSNMNMQERFKQNKQWSKKEILQPTNRLDKDLVYKSNNESIIRKLSRLLTLNGHLLPDFMFIKHKTIFQPKGFRATFRQVFRYKYIYYEYTPLMKGYIATQDRQAFNQCLKTYIKLVFSLLKNFRQIKKEYKKSMPTLMTKSFWESIYNKESKQKVL